MTKPLRPFHLAFPIYDISSTIHWYQNTLGCKIGRQDKKWVDFDFFGHQISGHLANKNNTTLQSNLVDGKEIPIRHFGIILDSSISSCKRGKKFLDLKPVFTSLKAIRNSHFTSTGVQ